MKIIEKQIANLNFVITKLEYKLRAKQLTIESQTKEIEKLKRKIRKLEEKK